MSALAKAIKRYAHQEAIISVKAREKIMIMKDAIRKIAVPNISYLKFVFLVPLYQLICTINRTLIVTLI